MFLFKKINITLQKLITCLKIISQELDAFIYHTEANLVT